MRQRGFTFVELLVSIGIISVLLALIVPAVQVARESARNTQCRANLQQIGLALHNYESQFGMLPACSVKRVSWHVAILPFVDKSSLFDRVDYSTKEPTRAIAESRISIYLCPSESVPDVFRGEMTTAATNYLGNSGTGLALHGYDGLFNHFKQTFTEYPEGPVRFADITDGLSATAAVSEVLHSIGGPARDRLRVVWNTPLQYTPAETGQFKADCVAIPSDPATIGWVGSTIAHGWKWVDGEIGYSTYNHMLTPMQPSCFNGTQVQSGIYSAASNHRSVVNVLYADGHTKSTATVVDKNVWVDIGSRNGSGAILP